MGQGRAGAGPIIRLLKGQTMTKADQQIEIGPKIEIRNMRITGNNKLGRMHMGTIAWDIVSGEICFGHVFENFPKTIGNLPKMIPKGTKHVSKHVPRNFKVVRFLLKT